MAGKIILNLAISLDGYICDENGGFDWIVGQNDRSIDTEKKFSFEEFLNTCDIVVMGKTAYEHNPEEGFAMYGDKKIYVITSSIEKPSRENVEFISGDFVSKIIDIRDKENKNIWLFGGAASVDQFIKKDVIDEYIIGIIPTILGKGVKLFGENNPMIKLQLKESIVDDGVAMLLYTKRK